MPDYQTPPSWSHGDIPAADNMNIYSDDLEHIHDLTGDAMLNYALATETGDIIWFMFHRYRWLIYNDNGTIVDPENVGETITLDNPTGPNGYYDLNTISWLAPGYLYQLVDVDWAVEVEVVT